MRTITKNTIQSLKADDIIRKIFKAIDEIGISGTKGSLNDILFLSLVCSQNKINKKQTIRFDKTSNINKIPS